MDSADAYFVFKNSEKTDPFSALAAPSSSAVTGKPKRLSTCFCPRRNAASDAPVERLPPWDAFGKLHLVKKSDHRIHRPGLARNAEPFDGVAHTSQSIYWYAQGEERDVEGAGVRVTVRFVARRDRQARIAITGLAGALLGAWDSTATVLPSESSD
jgi:hypothetical protein